MWIKTYIVSTPLVSGQLDLILAWLLSACSHNGGSLSEALSKWVQMWTTSKLHHCSAFTFVIKVQEHQPIMHTIGLLSISKWLVHMHLDGLSLELGGVSQAVSVVGKASQPPILTKTFLKLNTTLNFDRLISKQLANSMAWDKKGKVVAALFVCMDLRRLILPIRMHRNLFPSHRNNHAFVCC